MGALEKSVNDSLKEQIRQLTLLKKKSLEEAQNSAPAEEPETPEENETVAVNKAVTLSVPGATPKDAVKYSTKLTWILSDIPTEEE